MSKPDASVELLLSTFRDDFLAEIPDRCNEIESSILDLEKKETFTSVFKNLFRSIHSLKGSGGTMGLPIITVISHQFEDMLSEIDGDFRKIQNNSIDSLLKYNDLLKVTSLQIVDGSFNEESVRQSLDSLVATVRSHEISCMIVEPSKMMSRAITKELQSDSFYVSTCNNGFQALERLLNEDYDILITSRELPVLNGIALISALRKSETKNADIPYILTTSKDNNDSMLAGLNIRSVVKKDQQLVKSIKNIVSEILAA